MADPKTYKVTLTWGAIPDVLGYRIYKNGSFVVSVTNTQYVFTGLTSPLSQYSLSVESYFKTAACSPQRTTVTPQEPT